MGSPRFKFRKCDLSCTVLPGILLLFISPALTSAGTLSSSKGSDQQALLDFKDGIIDDPNKILSSWNESVHVCSWIGVSCSPSNGRVVSLNLEAQGLVGSLTPSIGNITYLSVINLRDNAFGGEIPEQIGRLRNLKSLNLSQNSFIGKIPYNLSNCRELTEVDVSYNVLQAEIPELFSSLTQLLFLNFRNNNLTGTIPPWIGNFSSLQFLKLAENNLQGSIPSELGKLSRLVFLHLYGNQLSGTIPLSLYNLSSMYHFSVAQNQLHGQLRPDIGITLPKLTIFAAGVNNFTGPIPESLANASGLLAVDFAQNGLTGPVPRNLGRLVNIKRLNFDDNHLGSGELGDLDFLSSLVNCTWLQVLGLAGNHFAGELPSFIANFSIWAREITMGDNLIHGSIPSGMDKLERLYLLGLENNYLSGTVPDAIGKLKNLQGLYLSQNQLFGSIPSSLGNLTKLSDLYMEKNRFDGKIPSSLGNCPLQNLSLSFNNLTGTIPKQLFGLSSILVSLVLSHNSLTGSLPSEIGNLESLMELDLSENNLTGKFPATLGSCTSLELLHLEGNKIEGIVPESWKSLRGLREVDLSRNKFSGKIPEFLGRLSSLVLLNLSYNDFEGEFSRDGIFANASALSVTGNYKICGGVSELHLPPCSNKKKIQTLILKIVIPSTLSGIMSILLLCSAVYYMARNSRTRSSSSGKWQGLLTYSDIMRTTNGLAEENLIGFGSFGSVYKGIIISGDQERTVAIKVMNLQERGASKSFIDECNALRSIRHRNLLRVITACSTVDHQGNDFKCLVFEFMCNGNLDDWLHPRTEEHRRLSLNQRLDIAIHVASALYYLHYSCETPIIHCDLKPSNVLLDEDMTAHVGDFGVARFLLEASNDDSETKVLSACLRGSVGYIPPEYGQGTQVSRHGDVYAYGILLLEMFTGKRPTDELFKEDESLHHFVATALPEQVMDIIDLSMLVDPVNNGDEPELDRERARTRGNEPQVNERVIEECVVSVMRIGVSCSLSSPGERMTMDVVVRKLHGIRDTFLRPVRPNRRRMPRRVSGHCVRV